MKFLSAIMLYLVCFTITLSSQPAPISDLVDPSLSTIEQPAQELGQKATELMLKQLDNREEFEPETVVVPTRLVVRNSTKRK